MTRDLFLGIDLGTSAIKAIAVDATGLVVAEGSREIATRHDTPGAAEQDPAEWWQAATGAVRQALAGDALAGRVRAIGLTGQMHGTVLLDGQDRVLHPAIIWADTRSADAAAEITAEIGAERVIQIAGSPAAAGFQAATLRWLQRHAPDVWRAARRVFLPKDWLRWRLTGIAATDPSDAAGTLLLDRRTRDWSPDLLQALGLDPGLLPPIQPSAAVAGSLGAEPAGALGLPAGIPVVTGGGDAPCAALAAGVVDPSAMLVTISTGGQVIVPFAQPETDPAGRIHTFCSCLEPAPGRAGWYQMGAIMTAGLAMRWLRDEVYGLPQATGYDAMTAQAAAVPPGAGGLLFLPYLAGERTPHLDPHARGLLLGLTAGHHRGHLTRAVMEGVALALFDAFDVVRSLGAEPSRIVLAGGGARSPLWRQIVADVFGITLSPLASASTSGIGATLLAAAATGAVDLVVASHAWPSYGGPVTPSPDRHERYQALLPIYRAAYRKHRDDFRALASL